jgi:hypothetical protein
MLYLIYIRITNRLSTPNKHLRVVRVSTLNSFYHQFQSNVATLACAWQYCIYIQRFTL